MSSDGNIKLTRTRSANFTKEEQILLFEAIKPYRHIIESKKPDAVKQSDKHVAWGKVTEAYNSIATGPPRTTENLISCYRNVKNKLKKERSEAKKMLVDHTQRGSLIKAIEQDGKGWVKVAATSRWNDPELCENGFKELTKESQIEDNKMKKFIMGTGGSPHKLTKNNDDLQEIKKIMEPQIDGLYTIYYDSDAGLMRQFQQTIPEAEQVQPIEAIYIEQSAKKTTSEKKTIRESYKQLAEAKLELVKLQTLLLQKEITHKERVHEIEMGEIIKENKFKEIMREKELELIEIKIANAKKL